VRLGERLSERLGVLHPNHPRVTTITSFCRLEFDMSRLTMKPKTTCVFVLCIGSFLTARVPAAEGPVAWWAFDSAEESVVVDRGADRNDRVEGNFKIIGGPVGSSLLFDGFTTVIERPAAAAPRLDGEFSVEAWVAQGAYPWNWCPIITQQRDEQAGYAFSVGPRGEVRLQVAMDGMWQSCTSEDWVLPLRQWIHIAATFDADKGIVLYANGERVGTLELKGQVTFAPDVGLRIGTNHKLMKPSHIHREQGTVASFWCLDGAIDELKVYNRVLSSAEVAQAFADAGPVPDCEIQPRRMPSGPKGLGRFGAVYCKLKYYEQWDALWRVDEHPDVLVRFDQTPVRVVFWRGSRYSPAWVTDQDQWMADQSVEAWKTGDADTEGCFEHMQDRLCRYSHVRIIESHDARTVVHWRYAPVSSKDNLWNVDEKTGRACWIDEYYTIYPDAIGVRKPTWKTGTLGGPRQFQESLPFTNPDQTNNDVVERDFCTVANMQGEQLTLRFVENPAKTIEGVPEELTIQRYNFRSPYDPVVSGHDDALFGIGQNDIPLAGNQRLARDEILAAFLTDSPCQRSVGSHVFPTAGQQDTAGIVGFLHDSVIDRAVWHVGIQLGQYLFARRRIPGSADLRQQPRRLRQVHADFGQDRFRLPGKLPGIPTVSPFVHVLPCDLQFGFLRESGNLAYFATGKVNGLPQLLPANQRAGRGGFDSKGHQLIRIQLQEGRRTGDGRIEPVRGFNDLICGQHDHGGRRASCPQHGSRKTDGAGRVAQAGFVNEVFRWDLGKGRLRCRTILDVRQDDDLLVRYVSAQLVDSQFDQRPASKQLQELLRSVSAAQRPEARSPATSHDHRITIIAQHARDLTQVDLDLKSTFHGFRGCHVEVPDSTARGHGARVLALIGTQSLHDGQRDRRMLKDGRQHLSPGRRAQVERSSQGVHIPVLDRGKAILSGLAKLTDNLLGRESAAIKRIVAFRSRSHAIHNPEMAFKPSGGILAHNRCHGLRQYAVVMAEIVMQQIDARIHGSPCVLGSTDRHLPFVFPIVQLGRQRVLVDVRRNALGVFLHEDLPGAGADTATVMEGDRRLNLDDDHVPVRQEIHEAVITPTARQRHAVGMDWIRLCTRRFSHQ
jgi:hypothetical protein